MLNKYKEEYNRLVELLTKVHNCHVDMLDGPNMRKTRDLKKALKELGPAIKDFRKVLDLIGYEVTRRTRGGQYKKALDPKDVPQETHDWVSKGLNRVHNYNPNTTIRKRKNKNG